MSLNFLPVGGTQGNGGGYGHSQPANWGQPNLESKENIYEQQVPASIFDDSWKPEQTADIYKDSQSNPFSSNLTNIYANLEDDAAKSDISVFELAKEEERQILDEERNRVLAYA